MPVPLPSVGSNARAAAALGTHHDTLFAARDVAAQLEEHLVGGCDLLLLFASFHHRAGFVGAAEIIREAVGPKSTLGVTAESVLANGIEREGRSGLAALALRLPGVGISTFRIPGNDQSLVEAPGAASELRERLHVGPEHRGTILLADPFSTPTGPLLELLGRSGGHPPVQVVGGLASGASQPGQNVMLLDDSSDAFGAVGVTLSGDMRVDAIVSQGCRPIGQPMLVTKADGNVIKELGGRPAIAAAQEMAEKLRPNDRALVSKGLLLGLVIDEYKPRFGRGDFVVRGLLGGDRSNGSIAIGDLPRVGQTVQFHVRDRETADEDLRLLLDAEQLDATPLATLLFTCNGRGKRLFEGPHHDAALLHQRLGQAPIAGFFAAGEIGPVGGSPFLHGHTAVAAVLRR
jgi:small ligand-binding sensory domain FIST